MSDWKRIATKILIVMVVIAELAVCGLGLWGLWYTKQHPIDWGPGLPPLQLLLGVFAGVVAGAVLSWIEDQGRNEPRGGNLPWYCVMWAARAGLGMTMLFFVLLWRHASFGQFLFAGAVLALLAAVHQVSRRQWLGWIVDERGERQKVDHWNRGKPIILSPTTRENRLSDEAVARAERRRKLLIYGPIGGALGALSAYLFPWDTSHVFATLAGMAAAPPILIFGWNLIFEILYLAGYQDMAGHKVLDPERRKTGLDDVTGQKVHGDASIASEAEADDLLNPR